MNSGRALAWASICLSVAAPLGAQNYAQVSGVILDPSSSSVPGATVTVVNEDTGFRRVTQSEADGGYVVRSLLPGVYKITVRKGGFRTVIQFGIPLNPSQHARVDFKLVVGSVQETITVQGLTPLLNSDDASVGATAGRDEIERLPLNGRGMLSLFELAPGVAVTPATRSEAGQFTVNGQRPNTNYFTVDGVSANSGVIGGGRLAQSTGGALPGMTAFGSLDGLVSHDALEEVRVLTSTTTPEFGRLPGAQISLTSRSGSNEVHGSLFYGVRNEKLDANDWFANQQGDSRAPLKLNDFAATLGAPLLRNRTFVFLSYERMRLSQPQIWRQPVPSSTARENAPAWVQPMLNLFAPSNGNDLGNSLVDWTGRESRPSWLDAGSIRIDHAVTSKLTAFARYSDSPSATEFGSSPVNLLDLRSKGVTAGLSLRAGPNLVFDLRANASTADASSLWQGDPASSSDCYHYSDFSGQCGYLARLSIAGVGHVVSGSEGRRSQSQVEINQVTGFNRGTHSVQVGADYIRLAPTRRDSTSTISVMADTVAGLDDKDYWYLKFTSAAANGHRSRVFRLRQGHLEGDAPPHRHLRSELGDQPGPIDWPGGQFPRSGHGLRRRAEPADLAVSKGKSGAAAWSCVQADQQRPHRHSSRRGTLLRFESQPGDRPGQRWSAECLKVHEPAQRISFDRAAVRLSVEPSASASQTVECFDRAFDRRARRGIDRLCRLVGRSDSSVAR